MEAIMHSYNKRVVRSSGQYTRIKEYAVFGQTLKPARKTLTSTLFYLAANFTRQKKISVTAFTYLTEQYKPQHAT
jgi:hypothetical protein